MIGAVIATGAVLLLGLRKKPRPQTAFRSGPLPAAVPAHLVAIYENRWDQVRYLNELDQKSVILVITALTGAVVSADRTINIALMAPKTIAVNPIVYFALLSVIVSAGAIYTTAHNRLSMERAMTAIDCLEVEFNRIGPHMFPYSGRYPAPAGGFVLFRRTMMSIRGPVILFFMAVLALSMALAGHAITPLLAFRVTAVQVRWASFGVTALATLVAFGFAGRAATKEFGSP